MAVSSFLKWYLFVGLLLSLVALDLVNAEVENEGEAVSHESTSEEESDESVESTAEDETEEEEKRAQLLRARQRQINPGLADKIDAMTMQIQGKVPGFGRPRGHGGRRRKLGFGQGQRPNPFPGNNWQPQQPMPSWNNPQGFQGQPHRPFQPKPRPQFQPQHPGFQNFGGQNWNSQWDNPANLPRQPHPMDFPGGHPRRVGHERHHFQPRM